METRYGDVDYVPLEPIAKCEESRQTALSRTPREYLCGFHKLNLILLFVFVNFFVMGMLLGTIVTFTPAAYEIFQLVHDNKDRADSTIETVLRVSEELELVLLDIRSFLEFKLVDALCSSRIIRNTIGGFFCSERSTESTPDSGRPDTQRRGVKTLPEQTGKEEDSVKLKKGLLGHQRIYNILKHHLDSPEAINDAMVLLQRILKLSSNDGAAFLQLADVVCAVRQPDVVTLLNITAV